MRIAGPASTAGRTGAIRMMRLLVRAVRGALLSPLAGAVSGASKSTTRMLMSPPRDPL